MWNRYESYIIHFIFSNYISNMVVVEFVRIYWEDFVYGGYFQEVVRFVEGAAKWLMRLKGSVLYTT